MMIDKKKYYNAYRKTKKGIQFDQEGYADAQKYKPMPYELVEAIDLKGKKKCCWWAQCEWDGINLSCTEFVKWKYIPYEEDRYR